MLPPLAWTVVQAVASTAWACPVCDTGTGAQVRAGLFDADFGRTLVAVLLPFPILLAVVAMIHFGWPFGPRRSRPPRRDDVSREEQR